MLYKVKPIQGDRKGTVIFESENWNFAKTAAENYKRDTGTNCNVESVSVVYTTTTLEEALRLPDPVKHFQNPGQVRGEFGPPGVLRTDRPKWDGTAEHARVINADAARGER